MMRNLLLVGMALLAPALASAEQVGSEKTWDFVALGDMPYNIPADYERFENLIGAVNRIAPELTLHLGDIKSGSSLCSDENFAKVKEQFRLFDGPLVYTPGDNEWTDCHREKAGRHDPLERLAKVREMFFGAAESHGKKPIALERQADLMPEHKTFVENSRFERNGVVFAMVHVVGSNNNLEARDSRAAAEFFARDAANLAWIKDSFAKAKAASAVAVVLGMQADLWEVDDKWPGIPTYSGFANTIATIAAEAKAFAKPVLVTHGDGHTLDINRFMGVDDQPVKNVIRLHVPGADLVEAVRVFVDPENPAVFTFQLITVPANKTM